MRPTRTVPAVTPPTDRSDDHTPYGDADDRSSGPQQAPETGDVARIDERTEITFQNWADAGHTAGSAAELASPDSPPTGLAAVFPTFAHWWVTPRARRLLTAGCVAVILATYLLASFGRPSDYVVMEPGPTFDVTRQITGAITDPEFGQHGELRFTTVNVRPISFGEWLTAKLPFVGDDLDIVPAGTSNPTQKANSRQQMESSKLLAANAAARVLDQPVGSRPVGAKVTAVVQGSPAEQGGIRAGDIIVSATAEGNTKVVVSAEALVKDLAAVPGTTITFGVVRGGENLSLPAKVGGDGRIGVEIVTAMVGTAPLDVKTDDVGGASAGLMITLGMVDALSPGDLTGDLHVAGTGTIDETGKVGPIKGVEHKVVAARRDGAAVFFAPLANYNAALTSAPPGIEVVLIETADDAVAWLCAHGATDDVCRGSR